MARSRWPLFFLCIRGRVAYLIAVQFVRTPPVNNSLTLVNNWLIRMRIINLMENAQPIAAIISSCYLGESVSCMCLWCPCNDCGALLTPHTFPCSAVLTHCTLATRFP